MSRIIFDVSMTVLTFLNPCKVHPPLSGRSANSDIFEEKNYYFFIQSSKSRDCGWIFTLGIPCSSRITRGLAVFPTISIFEVNNLLGSVTMCPGRDRELRTE